MMIGGGRGEEVGKAMERGLQRQAGYEVCLLQT